jgi:formate/nitrite transporter FocA (FNT family)
LSQWLSRFAALHAYAPESKKTLSLSALVLVALMAGITICVHFIVLTVGRQANETTLPGFKNAVLVDLALDDLRA